MRTAPYQSYAPGILIEPEETLSLLYGAGRHVAAQKIQKGLRDEDKPFHPGLGLTVDARRQLASILPRTANPEVADAVHARLANFLEQLRTATGAWIFYSRDNNHYIGLRRYVPDYSVVTPCSPVSTVSPMRAL